MGLSKSNPPTAQVKLLVSPTTGRIPWSLLSWLALGSGGALLVAMILSGAKLIVDPYSPNWLKTAFPGLVNTFEAAPQTADEIQAEMRAQNITHGQPIAWPRADQPKAWFYPILNSDDKTIQELWVYRVQNDQLQRVEQVKIRPMKESFITTPLVGTASQVASVDSDASLSSVQPMAGKAANEPWLLLEGQRRYGNTVMRYGQILSYQSHAQRLHRLLNWSSPAGQPPQWKNGDTGKQLIVDQTVGLRPSFLLYQLVPNDPPRLQEVSLYRSVYEQDLSTSLYDKALKLAQGSVWSHSLQMMESAKATLGHDWSAEAQAQLDLIQLHATRTKAQTDQTLSSQQQHILAYLIDGQWDKALSTLENNPAIYGPTLKRLERDFDALWRGVTTHLQVHPKDVTTQIWGALLVTSRQSPEAGEEWLQKKTRSKATLERLQALGGQKFAENIALINGYSDTNTSTASLPATNEPGRYTSLIGQATAVGAPGHGWLRSQTLPTLAPGQSWYHINVQLLQDNTGWGRPPVAITATNMWAESVAIRRQLQLFSGNRHVAGVTVHGVQTTGSRLTFLASGPKINGSTLVTTPNSLQWLTTLPWQTAPTPPVESRNATNESSVDDAESTQFPQTDFHQTDTLTLMAEAISRQLGLTFEQTAQLYPHLQYIRMDLMGDRTAEHIFTMGPGVPSELGLFPGKVMILSDNGKLLYSDVGQQRSLLAITGKTINKPATLLVEQAGRYDLIGF
ncbi:hypothetical protein D0962_05550 [Leptolyngbyaceae cyanobacterium CCMR0082]|uniref:Uncharacterized protein n=1 Tax=Adonisia turfae CCMR0082 TaxID=2304604 RepID=A0A6M0S1J2_9CYAN|nr:hypothetical protein [Adonisia turfae]NEZ62246.1 hypothetical protein [Adonisia turfae CCMR0082]